MISRSHKEKQVQNLSESFNKSQAAFLVNPIGMDVDQMTLLRKNLKARAAKIKVIRNTLARLSLKNHSSFETAFSEHLKGPNAFVMVFGEDVPGVAKIIDSLAEELEVFQVKCGVFDGLTLTSDQVGELAKLPSREILRSQLLSCLQAPMSGFLRTLQAAPSSMLRLLNSYKQKKGE